MRTELVEVCPGGLPPRAAWAEGLRVRVPAALAGVFKKSADAWEDEYLRNQARRAADDLRLRAAFTESPPLSARLPVSYRTVPGSLRQLVAGVLGRWQRGRT